MHKKTPIENSTDLKKMFAESGVDNYSDEAYQKIFELLEEEESDCGIIDPTHELEITPLFISQDYIELGKEDFDFYPEGDIRYFWVLSNGNYLVRTLG